MLKLVSEMVRFLPASKGWWQKVVGFFVGEKTRVGDSWRIFPSPREVRFHEMEYHVPAARGPECLAEAGGGGAEGRPAGLFPIEFRYVAGDDIWLSPFQGGPRAAIAVHQYCEAGSVAALPAGRADPAAPWRPAALGQNVRPRARQGVTTLYPDWERWQAVRRRLDPRGKFLNAFLRRIFGEAMSAHDPYFAGSREAAEGTGRRPADRDPRPRPPGRNAALLKKSLGAAIRRRRPAAGQQIAALPAAAGVSWRNGSTAASRWSSTGLSWSKRPASSRSTTTSSASRCRCKGAAAAPR